MTRSLVCLTFASLLGLTSLAAADQKKFSGPPAARGTTRIATINLGQVIADYDKARDFKNGMASNLKQMQEEAKRLQQNLNTWQMAVQKGEFGDSTREQVEEKIIAARRRLEDLNRMAQNRVGKTQQAYLEELWRDIDVAVKEYSAKHGIDLVIAYGDPVRKEDAMKFLNLDRKLRTVDQGGVVPFFMGTGVDISHGVTEMLNQKYREARANTPNREAGSR